MKKDSTQCPIINRGRLRKQKSQCDSVLIGNPSLPCRLPNFQGPTRTTYNTAERAKQRLAWSRMCYAPSPDTFPLSALARRSPYRINRTLNLGPKFVLLPNEVRPSESKHHSSCSSLCVAWACLHPYLTSVYIRVSVLFVFCLTDPRHSIETEWPQQTRKKQATLAHLFFVLFGFCFV